MKAMIPQLTEADLLARQAERESNARTYPRGIPLAIERASGVEVFGVDGRRFLDFFAGAGVLALGHNHPRVVDAVAGQLGRFVHGLDFPSPARDDLTTELFATLPDSLRDQVKVHFCAPTGSDAVEAAIKLCKRATGRRGVVAFSGAYHGMTAGALSVTSLNEVKERVPPLMPEVAFTPYGYCHRCAANLVPATCGVACAALFESLLSDTHSGVPRPAATIMEFVQGEGGSIVPPRDFVARVRTATLAANVPLIADEIQAGFGRTGRFWAFEHFDVVPDVIVISKALGGIGLPIAAIVYKKQLDVWEPGTHIGTFRGHQLAMAAGAAALRVFREDRVLDNVRARGDQLFRALREIRSPAISEVRGLGLMVGIDSRTPRRVCRCLPSPSVSGPHASRAVCSASLGAVPTLRSGYCLRSWLARRKWPKRRGSWWMPSPTPTAAASCWIARRLPSQRLRAHAPSLARNAREHGDGRWREVKSVALPEDESCGTRVGDHGRVVGATCERWNEELKTFARALRSESLAQACIRRDAASNHNAWNLLERRRAKGLPDERIDHHRLKRGTEVVKVLSFQGLREARHVARDGTLNPREAELEAVLVCHRSRDDVLLRFRVALRSKLVDHRATRVAEAEKLAYLVKRFACSIIARRPELADVGGPRTIDAVQRRMAPGHQQAHERKRGGCRCIDAAAKEHRKQVANQVVDAHHRLARAPRQALGDLQADQKSARQSGTARDGDPVDVAELHRGDSQGLANHGDNGSHVVPRSDLGHDAAIDGMDVHLTLYDVRQDNSVVGNDGGAGLIAGCFDTQNPHGRVCV